MRCPECQAENAEGRSFCAACGAPIRRACAGCGFANEARANFCGGCGAPLHARAGAAAARRAYTPPHLAERILSGRRALEGERKLVTVLFADLKGSMEILANRDPEEARRVLDPVLERMMDAVHQYEGTVNQIMGDGIMALFGAPVAHEDHAERAGYAALKMQATIAAFASQSPVRDVEVRIRVGLNSGEVVVRGIGNDLTMDYSAIGQTTHLASRMEQQAAPGTILVTEAFARLTGGRLHYKPMGLIPVKGLAEPVEALELVDAEPMRGRFQAVAGRGFTPFVGRAAELTEFRRTLDRARAGKGQAVAVIGEPGAGKSRLFYEFVDSEAVRDWLTLETGSVSFGKVTAFLPIRDLLMGYFQIDERDAPPKTEDKLAGALAALDSSLLAVLPALRSLFDLPVRDPQWEALDAPERRRQILDAVKLVLVRQSQARPVLLVFENLHWIDTQTQAFLDSLIESLPVARILLLVNYRPEYRHTWANKTYYTQIRLAPLSAESSDELLRVLLGQGADLSPLKRLLIDRADGNPFFLEEGVRTLVEQKVLVGPRGSRRLAKELAQVQVPATVQAILAARIDALPPEHKRLLQCAAVIGRSLPLSLLRAVSGASEADLQEGLARLQAAEFLYETNLFPDIEYTFKHGLTQEVTYRSLLQERRRDLHARILASMEALYADRLDERVERLAHHAVNGAVWDRAVTYLRQAGHRALERSTSREAVSLFEQALGALEHLPQRRETQEQAIDIRLDLRLGLVPLAERERIAHHLETAEALARALDDRRRMAWIAYSMAHYHYMSHDQERAVAAGRRALELGGGDDFALEVAVNMVLGYALHTMGEFRPAIEVLRKNIDRLRGKLVRERFGLPATPAVTCRERLVRCVAELGEFKEGIERGREGLALAEEIGQPLGLTQMYSGLGLLYLRKGDLEHAIPVLERGMAVGRQWQISLLVATLISAVGHVYVLLGRVAEGMPLLQEGFEMAESRGAMLGHALRVIWLAEGHLVEGRADTAREHATRALQLSRDHKEKALQAWALKVRGDVDAAGEAPDVGAAERSYAEAVDLAAGLGMRPLLAHCHLGLGALRRRAGRAEASASLAAAASLFDELDMPFWRERAAKADTL